MADTKAAGATGADTNPAPEAEKQPGSINDLLDTALEGLDLDDVFKGTNEDGEGDDSPEPTEEKEAEKPATDKAAADKAAGDKAKDKSADTKESKESGEEEPPKGLDAKATVKWKELKSEAKAAREERDRLKAELEEAKKDKADPQEITRLKEELESLKKNYGESEAELNVARVEGTQEFKAAITKPTNDILGLAEKFAEKYSVDKSALVSALQNSDSNKQSDLLTALTQTFNERDRLRVYRMADDLLELGERKKVLLENSKATLERITAKRKADMDALTSSQKANYDAALNSVEAELKSKGSFFHTEGDDLDNEHVTALKGAYDTARKIDLDQLQPKGRAYAAMAGALFPIAMQRLGALQAKLAEAQAELQKINSADPGAGGGSDAEIGDGPDTDPEDVNAAFEQAAKRLSR